MLASVTLVFDWKTTHGYCCLKDISFMTQQKKVANSPVDSGRAWGWTWGRWVSWASPGWVRTSCRPPWLGWLLALTRSSASWTFPLVPCLCSHRPSTWHRCYSWMSLATGLQPGGHALSQDSSGWCGPQDAVTWCWVFCMCCHYPSCHPNSTNLPSAAYRCRQIYVLCSCCVCCVCGGFGGGDGGGVSRPGASRFWYRLSWRNLLESATL